MRPGTHPVALANLIISTLEGALLLARLEASRDPSKTPAARLPRISTPSPHPAPELRACAPPTAQLPLLCFLSPHLARREPQAHVTTPPPRRHPQRRLHPHLRRRTQRLGRLRPPLRRLGDLPPERLARRPQPHLRLAIHAAGSARSSSAPTTAATTWDPVGNKFTYDGVPGTHQWYDGTPHPWEFKRVWHLEPSLTDPDTVYAGVEDAALFRSTDGGPPGRTLRPARPRHRPRAGSPAPAACACTPSSSTPPTPTASTSPSPPPAPSAPTTAAQPGSPSTRACTPIHPRSHRRSRPLRPPRRHAPLATRTPLHAKTLGRHALRRRRRQLARISGNLPTDFGFVIDVHAHQPETVYVVPIKSDSDHFPLDGSSGLSQPIRRQRVGAPHQRPPAKNCYVNVLRDAMAVDTLDDCGIYFGTTGGQVYCTPRRRRHLASHRPRPARRPQRRSPNPPLTAPKALLPAPVLCCFVILSEVCRDLCGKRSRRTPMKLGSPLKSQAFSPRFGARPHLHQGRLRQ